MLNKQSKSKKYIIKRQFFAACCKQKDHSDDLNSCEMRDDT